MRQGLRTTSSNWLTGHRPGMEYCENAEMLIRHSGEDGPYAGI